jgi:gamma-glutamyltranspeptidase/glutathione hydrolase
VLHDTADGNALVSAAAARAAQVDRQRARRWPVAGATGDTTYLCTADSEGNAVSLIQSNASGFGSWLVEPSTGINLHNRGMAFSLVAGHLAELRAGARPPHTLSPAMATRDGRLAAAFGTMGGDAQPQVLLQLAARAFVHGQSPATAVHARRWALSGAATGFDTWTTADGPRVTIEGGDPVLVDALIARGHRVEARPLLDHSFGHAHMITRDAEGFWAGAADPRAYIGSVAGG